MAYRRAEVSMAAGRRGLGLGTWAPPLAAPALLWALAGCSSVQLVPLEPALGSESVARVGRVEVRANADESQRPWTVPRAVTPVRLSVRNTGSEPVYVELEDIHLSGPDAAVHAVSPGSITPRRRISSLGLDPGSPFVAPQIGTGPYGRNEILVIGPPNPWTPPPKTTDTLAGGAEIVGSAFLGGAIRAGEIRTGLVYFRQVPANAGRLILRVPVRSSASKDATPQVLEIAYAVQT